MHRSKFPNDAKLSSRHHIHKSHLLCSREIWHSPSSLSIRIKRRVFSSPKERFVSLVTYYRSIFELMNNGEILWIHGRVIWMLFVKGGDFLGIHLFEIDDSLEEIWMKNCPFNPNSVFMSSCLSQSNWFKI